MLLHQGDQDSFVGVTSAAISLSVHRLSASFHDVLPRSYLGRLPRGPLGPRRSPAAGRSVEHLVPIGIIGEAHVVVGIDLDFGIGSCQARCAGGKLGADAQGCRPEEGCDDERWNDDGESWRLPLFDAVLRS